MNAFDVAETFNRRYATVIWWGHKPWVETHGYHHEVAPRLSAMSVRTKACCQLVVTCNWVREDTRVVGDGHRVAMIDGSRGLQSTDKRVKTGRVAQRRMNVWRDESVRPSLRDGDLAGRRTVG